MKKFAIVLMMALLVLGCVFAAAGDSKDANSGDKFVVKTTIDVIYPVYQIIGSNDTTTEASVHPSASVPEIEGKKVYTSGQLTNITIDVSLIHFGHKENDTTKDKTYIRYAKNVTVTIEAKKLENTLTSLPDGHVDVSANPTVTASAGITETADFKDTVTSSDNKVTVVAEYLTGKKVGNETFDQTIATCTFNWDVTNLTVGDTYKADVIVTYTNV